MLTRTPAKPHLVNTSTAPKLAPNGFFKAPDSPLDSAFKHLGPNQPLKNTLMGGKIRKSITKLQEQKTALSVISPSEKNKAMITELDERIRAAGVYQMQKDLEVMEGEVDNDYTSEFRDFLLGKSAYNSVVPWGKRKLVGNDFDIYLDAVFEKRAQFLKKIASLKHSGLAPSNIEDAWLYFMFVLKNPQIIDRQTEDMFLKPWDNFFPEELSKFINKNINPPIPQDSEIVPRLSTGPEDRNDYNKTEGKYSRTIRETFDVPPTPEDTKPILIDIPEEAKPATAPSVSFEEETEIPLTRKSKDELKMPSGEKDIIEETVEHPLSPTEEELSSPLHTIDPAEAESFKRYTASLPAGSPGTPYVPPTGPRKVMFSDGRKVTFEDDATDPAMKGKLEELRGEEVVALDQQGGGDTTDPIMKELSFSIKHIGESLDELSKDLEPEDFEESKKELEKLFNFTEKTQSKMQKGEDDISVEVIKNFNSLMALVYFKKAIKTAPSGKLSASPYYEKMRKYQDIQRRPVKA